MLPAGRVKSSSRTAGTHKKTRCTEVWGTGFSGLRLQDPKDRPGQAPVYGTQSLIGSPITEGTTTSCSDHRQVFWLTDHPTNHAFSAERDIAFTATHPIHEWLSVAFVPDHSGGSTVDSHHLPFWSVQTDTGNRDLCTCQRCSTSRVAGRAWRIHTVRRVRCQERTTKVQGRGEHARYVPQPSLDARVPCQPCHGIICFSAGTGVVDRPWLDGHWM